MKAEDLRIGNYVIVHNPEFRPDDTGKVFKVAAIDSTRYDKEMGEGVVSLLSLIERENIVMPLFGQFIKYIKPIPLTEQWLIDFSFEKYEWVESGLFMKVNIFDRYTHLFIRFYNGEIHSNVAIIKKDKKGNYIDGQKDIKIKLNYVHTLQNFIALTGKELTK